MDLISREDALKWTTPEDWGTPDEVWRPESEYGRYIQSLPSAERKGKWIRTYLAHEAMGIRPSILYCSECQQCIAYPTNYCPNCGARMVNDEPTQAELEDIFRPD